MYPQFANHSFWITGESYAGHYIPELAKLILDENAAGNPIINLEGFMAGNPWTYAVTVTCMKANVISQLITTELFSTGGLTPLFLMKPSTE